MFESVDGRAYRRLLESHPISSPRAFGSGELKNQQTTKKACKFPPVRLRKLTHGCSHVFLVSKKKTNI